MREEERWICDDCGTTLEEEGNEYCEDCEYFHNTSCQECADYCEEGEEYCEECNEKNTTPYFVEDADPCEDEDRDDDYDDEYEL